MDKALILTAAQASAFKSLDRAFKKCDAAGLEIWGELTTLYAVNESEVSGRKISVGGETDNEITDGAESIDPKCFMGCGTDDGVGFET